MMRLMNNKKNVKIVSLVVGILFILSVAALAYTQMASGPQVGAQDVGYVNSEYLYSANSNSPLAPVLRVIVQQAQRDIENQYAEKLNKATTDADKEAVKQEMNKALQAKFMELQQFIDQKMPESTKTVREAKGLTIILKKEEVLYGGVDVSEQVGKKLASELQEHYKIDAKAIKAAAGE